VILQFGSQLGGDFFEFVRVVRGGSSGAQFTDTFFGIYGPDQGSHSASSYNLRSREQGEFVQDLLQPSARSLCSRTTRVE
jgi:hypothetical protein